MSSSRFPGRPRSSCSRCTGMGWSRIMPGTSKILMISSASQAKVNERSGNMKRWSMVVVLKFGILVLAPWLAALRVGALKPVSAAPLTVKVGYPQPSGAQIPLWVIPEAKVDQRYGLNVQVIYISGGARLTQSVVAGDIEMAMTGGAIVNAILSGADLVYIAIGEIGRAHV